MQQVRLASELTNISEASFLASDLNEVLEASFIIQCRGVFVVRSFQIR